MSAGLVDRGSQTAMESFGLFEFLTAFREIKGVPKCKELVGLMRINAGAPLPENTRALNGFERTRSAWATQLRDHCRGCGRCKWSRRDAP